MPKEDYVNFQIIFFGPTIGHTPYSWGHTSTIGAYSMGPLGPTITVAWGLTRPKSGPDHAETPLKYIQ